VFKPVRTLICLALLLVVAPWAAAQDKAASPAAAAASAAPTSASSTSASSTSAAPTSAALVFSPASLPAARVAAAYPVLPLVSGVAAPLAVELLSGALPPGMKLSPQGRLSGTPSRADTYRFVLGVVNPANPANAGLPTQQAFVLAVRPERAVATPAPTPTIPRALANEPPESSDTPMATVWRLTTPDIELLTEGELSALLVDGDSPGAKPAAARAPDPSASASASAPPPNPMALQKLMTVIAPLMDTEFPTRALLQQALAARQRAVCLVTVQETFKAKKLPVPDNACQPRTAAAKPAPAAGADFTLDQLLDAVLPAPTQQGLLRVAAKQYPFSQALPPRWSGQGCGCGPAQPDNDVYGIYPFWQAPPADAKAPQRIDFSAYTRIGYLGAFMGDDGSMVRSPQWDNQAEDGMRVALRHGTQLDLVLYRNDWRRLLDKSDVQLDQAMRRAARDAVGLINTRLDNWVSRTKRFVLPLWPHPEYLYTGLTVFFDFSPGLDTRGLAGVTPPASAQAADQAAFRRVFRGFMSHLIVEMEATKRPLTLNIVVPEDQLWVKDSAFSVADMQEVMERTRSLYRRSSANAPPEPQAQRGSVTTRLLVLLAEPTSDTKKRLRAQLDRDEELKSHTRIAFLDNVIPVLLFPTGPEPLELTGATAFQFDADLAYFDWQFGGVALWPVPVAGVGASDSARSLLLHNMRDNKEWWTDRSTVSKRVCTWVCPNRTPVRMLFQGLLLLGLVSLLCLPWVCNPKRRMPYIAYLIVCAALAAAVGGLLLMCDPVLEEVSKGNGLLFATLAVLLAGGLAWTFKRQVPDP
jgi:hypothetical protein